jgi:hypothetical protein
MSQYVQLQILKIDQKTFEKNEYHTLKKFYITIITIYTQTSIWFSIWLVDLVCRPFYYDFGSNLQIS